MPGYDPGFIMAILFTVANIIMFFVYWYHLDKRETALILEKRKTAELKEQLRAAITKAPSEICREYHLQNCHICDQIDCGDNMSPARKEIDRLKAKLHRLEHMED
jgi:predicted membrane protein